MLPISPKLGGTVSISASATSASTAITQSNLYQLLVTNLGDFPCYVSWGTSAPTATTADMPLAAGAAIVVTVPSAITHEAAVCDTGETTTVKFTPANGV